jgi:hypothetical protein
MVAAVEDAGGLGADDVATRAAELESDRSPRTRK